MICIPFPPPLIYTSVSEDTVRATCKVGPNGKPCAGSGAGDCVTGTVTFEQHSVPGSPCHISYEVTGLTKGLHGFHM